MAQFHQHGQVISRSRSVIAAAYRSASCLAKYIVDKDSGITCEHVWDYTNKGGVEV